MKKCRFFFGANTRRTRAAQAVAVWLALAVAAMILVWSGAYRCPLRWTLGFECPGCGITRASAALLRLDFAGAFAQNPLVFFVAGYAVFCSWAWVFRPHLLRRRVLWIVFTMVFAAFWIVRIVCFLNGQYPDFYEPDALLPKLFGWMQLYL